MPRPLIARIDSRSLSRNLAVARARAGHRRIWAVAKANAYGHGLERAVRAFADADGLALLEVEEAQRARALGWHKPILLLEGVFDPGELGEAARLRLTCVVHCFEQIEMIERRADPAPLDLYLKLDSGMNRLGFAPEEALALAQRMATAAAPLANHPHVAEVRQQGMILAIEVVKDKQKREPYPWQERRNLRIYRHGLKRGVLIRPITSTVYFMPPYVITPEEIDFMVQVAAEGIDLAVAD